MLGAEAVLVLSQTCTFFKLLLSGAERRRVRCALQLVQRETPVERYINKYISKGQPPLDQLRARIRFNPWRNQGQTETYSQLLQMMRLDES